MQIKIISTQDPKAEVYKREFVAEATQYHLQIMRFDNQEDMWNYLQDYGDFHSPFNLDVKSDAREVMILKLPNLLNQR